MITFLCFLLENVNTIQKNYSTLNGVVDLKCCTAAGCCSWKQDVVSVLCKHGRGVGEDVVRTFSRCSCSILHLSHTCCCTQASKLIHVFRRNQWKQKSCWKLVQKLVIHARSVFAGYSLNSLHHTPPTSGLFFWNMLNFIMNQLLSLSNLKHIQMLSVFPVNDVNSTLYESNANQKSNYVIVLFSNKEPSFNISKTYLTFDAFITFISL